MDIQKQHVKRGKVRSGGSGGGVGEKGGWVGRPSVAPRAPVAFGGVCLPRVPFSQAPLWACRAFRRGVRSHTSAGIPVLGQRWRTDRFGSSQAQALVPMPETSQDDEGISRGL